MVTPTNKHGKTRTRKRRAQHDKVTLQITVLCDNCGADKLSHRACPACGWHKGRVAVAVKKAEAAEAPPAAE